MCVRGGGGGKETKRECDGGRRAVKGCIEKTNM